MNRKQRRREAKEDKKKGSAPKVALKTERPAEALDRYRRILDKDPENVAALVGLVEIAIGTEKMDTAAALLCQALASGPEDPAALGALAKVEAVLDDPLKTARLHFDISKALKQKELFEEALIYHRKALRFDPAFAATDSQESLPLLIEGKLQQGWMAFEWRNTVGSLGPFTDMVWNGREDVSDKTVLVWGEQGIGDQIIFVNCLPDIISCAGQVIIEADERLVDLLRRSYPTALVHGSTRFTGKQESRWQGFDWLQDYPPVDRFIMQGSLPRFSRPTLESFPAGGGKLLADAGRTSEIAGQLAGLGQGLKVGICWRSLLAAEDRNLFYPPLECWRPLLSMPGLHFVNLQAGLEGPEKEQLEKNFGIELVCVEGLDLAEDIDGTAALVSALDAVVSTITYLPMLSAALDVPTWRISRGAPTDEWMFLGAENFPWFPDIHIGFGKTDADLSAQFETAAAGLLEL